MTIQEQVRRMLAEAVAVQPAPSGAPFEGTIRRHRRRRLRVAAAAVTALLLAAAVAVAGVGTLGTRPTLVPVAPAVPPGWKTFQSSVYNLRFAYPPDWVVGQEGGLVVVPRELAGPGGSKPSIAGPLLVTVGLSPDHYRFVIQNGTQVTPGRLAGGRAFIRWSEVSSGVRYTNYHIDWGRYCIGGGGQYCGSHSVIAAIQAANQALLDRYGATAERIIGTLAPMRPTQASTGDPTRPACRPEQWRPVLAARSKFAVDRPRWVIAGDVQYLRGPACHLQVRLRLTVERADGTAIEVPGTPSELTLAADLPEDGGRSHQIMRTATMWFWGWDNWCKQPLSQARVRVTADGGASTTRPLPPPSIQDPQIPCQPNAPWTITPLA
jgi:hypothetical protein